MINKGEVITIFFEIDEFCKAYSHHLDRMGVEDISTRKHRNKPCRMSDSEIITIPAWRRLSLRQCVGECYIRISL